MAAVTNSTGRLHNFFHSTAAALSGATDPPSTDICPTIFTDQSGPGASLVAALTAAASTLVESAASTASATDSRPSTTLAIPVGAISVLPTALRPRLPRQPVPAQPMTELLAGLRIQVASPPKTFRLSQQKSLWHLQQHQPLLHQLQRREPICKATSPPRRIYCWIPSLATTFMRTMAATSTEAFVTTSNGSHAGCG